MTLTRKVASLLSALERYEFYGTSDVLPKDIAYDSRRVTPGSLFVCWKGERYDGHAFAAEAVQRGAILLLCERYIEELAHVPQIVVPNSRLAMGRVAAAFYGNPSRKLKLVGVTGTNGKTTTTYLLQALLDAAGLRCGLIGTIGARIGDRHVDAARTTPEAPDIQRLLAEMLAEGNKSCVMEVSSHGIDRYRTEGCTFAVGVFTNLTQDHLDYHRTFADYRATKVRMFRELTEAAVINADDGNADHFIRACSVPVVRYGIHSKEAEVRAEAVRQGPRGVEYMAVTPAARFPVRLRLSGEFNVYNSLAAIAVGHHYGMAPETMAEALDDVQVPGRFEAVHGGQPFMVIVDYAHTPDGLENVLRAARGLTSKRVIVVFGAGGDRDRTKRPLMGRAAAEGADYVVITADNPRSEDPADICRDIEAGVRAAGRSGDDYTIIVDRRRAIRHAVGRAEEGDIVLIAGKGHETYQEICGEKIPFDDRQEVKLALEERFGSAHTHAQ